jgi:hypothetical protein
MIFRTIRNFSGKVPGTGLTLRATGLYFLVAEILISVVS